MKFKKYQRKPTFIDMAPLTFQKAREILKNGYKNHEVSTSKEDRDLILQGDDNDLAGFLATDGKSYWFVNLEYAKENYILID